MTDITRYRETSEPDSTVRCRIYFGNNGRMNLEDFYDQLARIPYPFRQNDIEIEVHVSWIEWVEPSTDEERISWIHVQALQENSHRDFIKRRYYELFGGSND